MEGKIGQLTVRRTSSFNMRQTTCLKDEVLKFQEYDDPYTLASPPSDAIKNNFDDIDRGI